jgi:hypothetical protein
MEEFVIRKEPVRARDESGARLFGWTGEELFTVGGVAVFAILFIPTGWAKLVVSLLGYLWVKYVRRLLPERFVHNCLNFTFRTPKYWRASQPDTQWVPPILYPKRRTDQ